MRYEFEKHPETKRLMNQRPLPLNTVPSLRSDDADSFIDLNRLTAIAARRSRVVAVCVVVCFLLGALYLLTATPVYTSQTQILLDDKPDCREVDPAVTMHDHVAKAGQLTPRYLRLGSLDRTGDDSIW